MSAAPKLVRVLTAPGGAAHPPATPSMSGRADAAGLAGRLASRVGNGWLPLAAWAMRRTGRAGLVGIALLLAATVFLLSTHLRVAAEVEALRADLEAARRQAATPAAEKVVDPAAALLELPARSDMPTILRKVFDEAAREHLAVDTGKYQIEPARGGVVRHRIAFPVGGLYPQIRAFIDATLATMPAVAVTDLVLERKAIGDPNIEAQIRMTVFTSSTRERVTGAISPGQEADRAAGEPEAGPPSGRVVASVNAPALFSLHSWFVVPPAPLPPPPPPPPQPTAPPFPYTCIGSFAPNGEAPVFFLAHGDRVVDVHVGDRLDGVYQFESAGDGQLVFVYLPLNVRQSVAAGVPR